jgi:hypothetical protein
MELLLAQRQLLPFGGQTMQTSRFIFSLKAAVLP